MLKISYADCLCLSPAILAQVSRITAQNREKNSLEPPISEV